MKIIIEEFKKDPLDFMLRLAFGEFFIYLALLGLITLVMSL